MTQAQFQDGNLSEVYIRLKNRIFIPMILNAKVL